MSCGKPISFVKNFCRNEFYLVGMTSYWSFSQMSSLIEGKSSFGWEGLTVRLIRNGSNGHDLDLKRVLRLGKWKNFHISKNLDPRDNYFVMHLRCGNDLYFRLVRFPIIVIVIIFKPSSESSMEERWSTISLIKRNISINLKVYRRSRKS